MKLRNFMFCVAATLAFLATRAVSEELNTMEEKMEESTESPIADMAVIDTVEVKSSTERPPTAAAGTPAATVAKEGNKTGTKDDKADSQRHTVADFIIHPLIAFKPRNPEDTNEAGKQASDSTTTPSPWQLFGFTAGQGLSSSVSNLAGQVTGWINDRIQIPGLIESPVRESTSTSTTTTTTPRPDVVVRVQHKASTRRPVISIDGQRPNRVDDKQHDDDLDFDDSDEDEDDDDFEEDNSGDEDDDEDLDEDEEGSHENNNRKRVQAEDDSNEEEHSDEDDEEDDDQEEEQSVRRPNNRRRPANQNQQTNRRRGQQQNRRKNPQRRRGNGNQRQRQGNGNANRRNQQESAQYDDEEDIGDEQENNDFYYGERPSMKRSQSQTNFIQRSQQSLLNQIRQLTRGQSPAEIGNAMRKSQRVSTKKKPQQATLLINHNGQTLYIAPELLENNDESSGTAQNLYFPQTTNSKKRNSFSRYPQPPLTTPMKRKGYPPQYITIPWSKLGLAPPDQVVSLAEGIQSQPLILNIPQSAINAMQNPSRKKSRPVLTPDAVPLLAEASLMDIFQPPKIPPSRSSPPPTINKQEKPASIAVVHAAKQKPKPSSQNDAPSPLPHRIRPGTIVEKAPAMDTVNEASENGHNLYNSPAMTSSSQTRTQPENSFIIVGDDNEPGLTRQVQPVWGEQRFYNKARKPFYEILPNGRLIFRQGRSSSSQTEEQVPVQVVQDSIVPQTGAVTDLKTTTPLVEEPILAPAAVQPVAATPAAAQPVAATPAAAQPVAATPAAAA